MTLSSHMRNFWPQNKVRGYLCHKWRVASWYTSVQACSKHTYDKDVTRDSKEDVDRQDEQEKTHGQKIPSALRAIFLAEKDSAQALWIAREEAAKNSERNTDGVRQRLEDETRGMVGEMHNLMSKARRGTQAKTQQESISSLIQRDGLLRAVDEARELRDSVRSNSVRVRRESAWEDIISRGTDAQGIGWLLRGYYRDHVCLMDSDELGDFELILGCTSKDLAAYVRREIPTPQPLLANTAYVQMLTYYRFWSVGHNVEEYK